MGGNDGGIDRWNRAAHGSTMNRFGLRRADVLALLALAIVMIAIHWRWFMPGWITDQDWYTLSAARLHELFPSPSLFDLTTNLGVDNRDALNYYPVIILMAAVARLGASPDLAARMVVMFPTIVLLAVGGYVFARTYKASVLAGTLAGLFYACNAYVDVIVARGQMTVAESAAWSAIALAASVRAVRPAGRVSDCAAACLCLGFTFVCDVRIALLTCTAAVLLCTVELRREALASQLRRAGAVAGGFALLLLYVFVPTLASHLHYAPPANYGDVMWLPRLSFTSLAQSLTFDHPLWYDNAIHPWRWKFVFFLIPVIAGFWLMFRDPEQRLRAVAIACLVAAGAILVAGTTTWFGPLYVWLFNHTWYMHLFRDPSKFTVLMMPGYALSFGVGATAIAGLFSQRWLRTAAALAFVLLAIWPSRPIVTGAQTQMYFPKERNPDEVRFERMLLADASPSRVLWAPVPDRFVPIDNRHPAVYELWFSQLAIGGVSPLADEERLSYALQSLGIGYIVVLRNESQSLGYPPTYVAYRTLRTYAALGAFGKPVIDGPVLSVFKVGNVMRFSGDSRLAYLRADELITPGTRYVDAVAPRLRGPIRSTSEGIIANGRLVRLPVGLRGAKDFALVPAQPPSDTLFDAAGALRFDGIMPEQEGTFARDGDSVWLTVPPWNGYVDVRVHVARVGAGRPYLALRRYDSVLRYEIRGLTRPGHYDVMLPGEDLPPLVPLRAAPRGDIRVSSVSFVPADYHGLIDPDYVARARPSPRISVLVPLSASMPVAGHHFEYRVLPLEQIEEFPATLSGFGRAPGVLAGPMSASPSWMTASVAHARDPDSPSISISDFAAAQLPATGSGVTFSYSVDRQLALGEILSLLVALALVACIIFDREPDREAG